MGTYNTVNKLKKLYISSLKYEQNILDKYSNTYICIYSNICYLISCYTNSSKSISEKSRNKSDSLYKLVPISAMFYLLTDTLVLILSLICILSCCFFSLLNKIHNHIFMITNNITFNICIKNSYIYLIYIIFKIKYMYYDEHL